MWIMSNEYQVLFIIVLTATYNIIRCDPISNTDFNSHIRDYATADIGNITNVKTLQKEELGRHETFAPAGNPIKFKEIPDSALSSSSNGRGLLYHDQPGYTLNDYEEGPHYTHGHDYHFYDAHSDVHVPHGYEHDHHDSHDPHDHHNHHDHHGHDHHHYSGHHHLDHYKHYKHALAAKTVLWPIAGIALLGAAAAIVSNPVLLQLGVVSGKRRRRDTEEITEPDFASDPFIKYIQKIRKQNDANRFQQENLRKNKKPKNQSVYQLNNSNLKKRVLNKDYVKDNKQIVGHRKIRSSVKRNIEEVTTYPDNYNSDIDDGKFIPIPIKLRTPGESE